VVNRALVFESMPSNRRCEARYSLDFHAQLLIGYGSKRFRSGGDSLIEPESAIFLEM
jgi:hypothetical protein